MQFRAEIKVMLRQAILDVEGKTVENALHSLGYDSCSHVRIGKHVVVMIDADDQESAREIAGEIATRVLSNPVMEDVEVEAVSPVEETAA